MWWWIHEWIRKLLFSSFVVPQWLKYKILLLNPNFRGAFLKITFTGGSEILLTHKGFKATLKVFWRFQGGQKETLRRKGLIVVIHRNLLKESLFYTGREGRGDQPYLLWKAWTEIEKLCASDCHRQNQEFTQKAQVKKSYFRNSVATT